MLCVILRLRDKLVWPGRRMSQVRLRKDDLEFLPYSQLVETLLHELAHNVFGPHDDQFWHLFCQLKVD